MPTVLTTQPPSGKSLRRVPAFGNETRPARAACLPGCALDLAPGETAGEFADLVEIALEVGEFVLACGFRDAFLAGQPRRADGEDTLLQRRTVGHGIRAANLEQAHVALTAIDVPGERLRHADQARGAQQRGVRGQWIRNDRRIYYVCRAEQRVFLRIHERNGDDFVVAQSDEALAQAVFGLGMGQARRGLPRSVQARRKFVEAEMPRHLFDQVHLARHVLPPRWLRAGPNRARVACELRRRPDICCDSHR